MSFRDRLKSAIDEARKKGITEIHLDNLEKYVDSDDEQDGSTGGAAERRQFLAALEIEHAKIAMAHEGQTYVQEFLAEQNAAEFAVKSVILVNGGASVALLAFLGNIASKIDGAAAYSLSTLNYSMVTFVAGVGVGGLTAGLRYFSQMFFTAGRLKTAVSLKCIAILSWVSSMSLFIGGGVLAYKALL